jgi:hypothetical protein
MLPHQSARVAEILSTHSRPLDYLAVFGMVLLINAYLWAIRWQERTGEDTVYFRPYLRRVVTSTMAQYVGLILIVNAAKYVL